MKTPALWVLNPLVMVAPSLVWAQQRSYGPWDMHPMWGGWGIGMMLMMLVFWGLIVVGLVLGIRWLILQPREGRPGGGDSPLDILKKRYARGEIEKEEYEQKKRDLSS